MGMLDDRFVRRDRTQCRGAKQRVKRERAAENFVDEFPSFSTIDTIRIDRATDLRSE